jgi:hypothetical protein
MRVKASKVLKSKVPSVHNWRTTDEDEIARRRLRAQVESILVRNLDPRFPIFSNFAAKSPSGLTYSVDPNERACPKLGELMKILEEHTDFRAAAPRVGEFGHDPSRAVSLRRATTLRFRAAGLRKGAGRAGACDE